MKYRNKTFDYKFGSWNVYCDYCGCKTKSDNIVLDSDGYAVCREHADPEHPQDRIQLRPNQRVKLPFVREAKYKPVSNNANNYEVIRVTETVPLIWADWSDNWENLTENWEDYNTR